MELLQAIDDVFFLLLHVSLLFVNLIEELFVAEGLNVVLLRLFQVPCLLHNDCSYDFGLDLVYLFVGFLLSILLCHSCVGRWLIRSSCSIQGGGIILCRGSIAHHSLLLGVCLFLWRLASRITLDTRRLRLIDSLVGLLHLGRHLFQVAFVGFDVSD